MSAPQLDDACRLEAVPHDLSELVQAQAQSTLDAPKILALVKQALELYKSSDKWPRSKSVSAEHDCQIIVTKGKAAHAQPELQQQQQTAAQARLAKCAWHARKSTHDGDKHAHKLSYQDFYEGLAVDHPVKEVQYIDDMLRYEKVQGEASNLVMPQLDGKPASRSISAIQGDVWISEYTTPPLTANRDFCELFLTVEFQPHPNPLSAQHIDSIVADIEASSSATDAQQTDAVSAEQSSSGRRSCMNIQLPIATSACPPQPKFVRAYYASVEILRELEENRTEWWMAVQSDSAGQVPLVFQEMAMPGKIAPDVPLFVGWAMKQRR